MSVPAEIVGVVGDVRSDRLALANDMEFYRPWAQENFPFMTVTVRSNLKTEAVTKLVHGGINTIDRGLAIAQPQSTDTVVAQALGQARLMMMALGAQTMDILRLVVNQGMRPVVFGLATGLLAALALGRLLTSQLYQTSAHNPLLLTATVAILGAAALLACLLPARRASLVNPVEALRAE